MKKCHVGVLARTWHFTFWPGILRSGWLRLLCFDGGWWCNCRSVDGSRLWRQRLFECFLWQLDSRCGLALRCGQCCNMLWQLGLRQFLLLFFRQLLVFLPLSRFFFGIQLLGTGIAFANRAPLYGSQFNPVAHTFLQTLLFSRIQGGEFITNDQPLFLAVYRHFVPFAGQRGECMLLRWIEFSPSRLGVRLSCYLRRGRLRRGWFRCCGRCGCQHRSGGLRQSCSGSDTGKQGDNRNRKVQDLACCVAH